MQSAIRARWLDEALSYVGFPVTDEMDWTDPDTNEPGRVSHFERGAIAWTAADGNVVEFPARRVFRSGHIGVSSVGGRTDQIHAQYRSTAVSKCLPGVVEVQDSRVAGYT